MLEGRDLVAGLGLEEFMLTLLAPPTSGTELNLRPAPVLTTLLGLGAFLVATTAGFGTVAGAGGSTEVIAARLRNIPLPGSQSKYLCP